MKFLSFRQSINPFIMRSRLCCSLSDKLGISRKILSDRDHLEGAIEWLICNHDNSINEGCFKSFSLRGGWLSSCPANISLILTTFLHYGQFSNQQKFIDRAINLGDWQINGQLPSGAILSEGEGDEPSAFDTGKATIAWCKLYEKTKMVCYYNAALKAADWLILKQNINGDWDKNKHSNNSNGCHSIVAWSLFEMYKISNDIKYKESAEKNVSFLVSKVKENGWNECFTLADEETAIIDNIVCTLRGMLECAFHLEHKLKQHTLNIVTSASTYIMRKYELNKKNPYSFPLYLSVRLKSNWKPEGDVSSLTGNAQLVTLWLLLFKTNNDARLLNAALKMTDQIKMTQTLVGNNEGIRGGVKDFHPIWGENKMYNYSALATSFFAEALMLQERIMAPIEKINA